MQIFSLAAAATGLFLIPFGSVSDLVRSPKPWHGFSAQDPVLWVARAQELKTSDCDKWVQALVEDVPQPIISHQFIDLGLSEITKPKGPWHLEDLDPVTDCDEFPCAVKLNQSEVKQMAASSEKARHKKYLAIVKERISLYLKSQAREEYEFPGKPIDPWALFDMKGFRTSLHRPSEITLWARKLNFAPGKIQPIHQILDWRAAKSPSGLEASTWTRDVYTDHYFDSWGEWVHISCPTPKAKTVLVVQAIVVEFDLLKKTDFFSKIMRGKMRSAVEDGGTPYLDRQFNRLKEQAQKLDPNK